MEPRLKSQPD